jgi:trans-2,3-dihydro-3-hydroxyanthranilate isomerase
MGYQLRIVDVFAERRYEGNPLAVVLDAARLASDDMQAIARETNLSETTFVCGREPNGSYRVRIFTPAEELPFAGHPTLGTASVLRSMLAAENGEVSRIVLALGVGEVPVDFEDEGDACTAWFAAPQMELEGSPDPHRLAEAVGLRLDDFVDEAPPRAVRVGPAFIFIALRSRVALERSRLDLQAFQSFADEGYAKSVYLFARETIREENDLCARVFFDANGVREDPATGSATAFLGAYLLEYPQLLGEGPLDLRIEQGISMKRPSLLRLRARIDTNGDRVIRVGGHVVPVIQGELL